jgi:hypothetical protein
MPFKWEKCAVRIFDDDTENEVVEKSKKNF